MRIEIFIFYESYSYFGYFYVYTWKKYTTIQLQDIKIKNE